MASNTNSVLKMFPGEAERYAAWTLGYREQCRVHETAALSACMQVP